MWKARAFRFTSKSIFDNLALEHWLLEHAPPDSLLLYVNRPCVVLGRNQVAWQECDLEYMKQHNVALARRHSGGGTVYHDEGNVCYCYVSLRAQQDRKANTANVIAALRDGLGIDAQTNERNDVLLDGRKCSGAAYRLVRDRAYHHGTLLVHSNLDRLQRSISSPHLDFITTRSTQSIRSKVVNLREVDQNVTVDSVCDALLAQHGVKPNEAQQVKTSDVPDDVRKDAHRLRQSDWVFYDCPKFHITYKLTFEWAAAVAGFHVARGGIVEDAVVDVPHSLNVLTRLGESLKGTLFSPSRVHRALLMAANQLPAQRDYAEELAEELARTMAQPLQTPHEL